MSATRLLVLGCVRMFRQAHGYVVVRELRSWSVDQWTELKNYGSIYHALRQMTKEGLLETVDEEPARSDTRTKTVYRLTRFGEEEYQRLLRELAWSQASPQDPFTPVMSFAESLPREEFMRVLRFRITWAESWMENLEATIAGFVPSSVPEDGRPWVVPEQLRLMAAHMRATADWARDLLERYERGEVPHPEEPT